MKRNPEQQRLASGRRKRLRKREQPRPSSVPVSPLSLPGLLQAEVMSFLNWRFNFCVTSVICKRWRSILTETPNWCSKVKCRQAKCVVTIYDRLMTDFPKLKVRQLQFESPLCSPSSLDQLRLVHLLTNHPVPWLIFSSESLEKHWVADEKFWEGMFKAVKTIRLDPISLSNSFRLRSDMSIKWLKFLGHLKDAKGEDPGPQLHLGFDHLDAFEPVGALIPRSSLNLQTLLFYSGCYFDPPDLKNLQSWSPIPKLILLGSANLGKLMHLEKFHLQELHLEQELYLETTESDFLLTSSSLPCLSACLTQLTIGHITQQTLKLLQGCSNLQHLEVQHNLGEENGTESEQKGEREGKRKMELANLKHLKSLRLWFLPSPGQLEHLGAKGLQTVEFKNSGLLKEESLSFHVPQVLFELAQFPISKLVLEFPVLSRETSKSFDWEKLDRLRALVLKDQEPGVLESNNLWKLPKLRHLRLHLAKGREWTETELQQLLRFQNLELLDLQGTISSKTSPENWEMEFQKKRPLMIFKY